MFMRLLRTALAVLAGALLVAQPSYAAGENAPDFTLRDIDGKNVTLSDLKGTVVLINFWATWCGPCKVEMPYLQKMHAELGEKGFTVVSISTDEARSSSQVKPYIKRNKYTFPVLLDTQTAVVSQYNPAKTLPYTVLVDREGKIDKVHQGYNPGDEVALRAEVEALVSKSAL